MGSSPVIGEPNTSNMKILPLSESLWPVSSLTPKPQLIPPLMLTPILGTATTVALDIMAMAIDSVMAMVATMVAIVPTAMAMDTMPARRGLLSLNQLLIPPLKPMLILGTPTTVDSDMAMLATDLDMVVTTVATMVWDTGAARRGLLRLNLNQLLILMLTPGIGTDTMAVASDTATGARPSTRSSDDISYDDIASFPRASLSGRSLSNRVLGTLRVHLFLINITNLKK